MEFVYDKWNLTTNEYGTNHNLLQLWKLFYTYKYYNLATIHKNSSK